MSKQMASGDPVPRRVIVAMVGLLVLVGTAVLAADAVKASSQVAGGDATDTTVCGVNEAALGDRTMRPDRHE